jgi:hypothetical protein
MEQGDSPKRAQPPLVDSILQNGELAFNPELPEDTRKSNKAKFDALIKRYHKIFKCLAIANNSKHWNFGVITSVESLSTARKNTSLA